MSRMRERHRKDANHLEIVSLARMLGWHWFDGPPLDGWAALTGMDWVPVEIKMPGRKGTPNEYTDAQQRFISNCRMYGNRWFVWRVGEDVLASTREAKAARNVS